MTNGRIVGFDRPGMQFPEDISDFFPEFLVEKLGERALNRPMSVELMTSIANEAFQLLEIAQDIYRLPITRRASEFWSVQVKAGLDQQRADITVIPIALRDCRMELMEGDDSTRLAIGESPNQDEVGLFIVAPSLLQAFIGLARMVETRRGVRHG